MSTFKNWRCPGCDRIASVEDYVERPICLHGGSPAPEIWDGNDHDGEGNPIELAPNPEYRQPGKWWEEMKPFTPYPVENTPCPVFKLWHDDIRRPPDDTWIWARTNEQAKDAFLTYDVVEVSLDHDLGLDDLDPEDLPDSDNLRGASQNGDGYDLVKWMCDHRVLPAKITIHSWNPAGARRMAHALADSGVLADVKPFSAR